MSSCFAVQDKLQKELKPRLLVSMSGSEIELALETSQEFKSCFNTSMLSASNTAQIGVGEVTKMCELKEKQNYKGAKAKDSQEPQFSIPEIPETSQYLKWCISPGYA